MALNTEIPDSYRTQSPEELKRRIADAKARWGERLVILSHHYQRMEIVPFGDFLGDSFALSRKAAIQPKVERIVFCGVHFMAESADILTPPEVKVYLPNPYAGCPMADMAPKIQVDRAWKELAEVTNETVIPISYMNSAAVLKAFCGRNGGLICTSSNARQALEWAFARGRKVFFFPDQHLGRNTAKRMGISKDDMILWKPSHPLGGNTEAAVRKAKVILWQGYCHVHMNFTLESIQALRAENPEIRIVVHPECKEEVVDAADAFGSTKFIVEYVNKQKPGTALAIGTELNLVQRLAHEHPEMSIVPLQKDGCATCVNMFRTKLTDLAWSLDLLDKNDDTLRIDVPEPVRSEARIALDRMLEIGG